MHPILLLGAGMFGLAPTFGSISAPELTMKSDRLHEARLQVGVLPVFPTNEVTNDRKYRAFNYTRELPLAQGVNFDF